MMGGAGETECLAGPFSPVGDVPTAVAPPPVSIDAARDDGARWDGGTPRGAPRLIGSGDTRHSRQNALGPRKAGATGKGRETPEDGQ